MLQIAIKDLELLIQWKHPVTPKKRLEIRDS